MPTNRFAAVQLTLLSVIVALILENLLNQVSGATGLDTWHNAIPWLQAAAVAVTVITIWSGFALILSGSDRPPATIDFIYPFGLLITLSLAANSLNTAQPWQFFMLLGLGAVFAVFALRSEQSHIETGGVVSGVRRAVVIQSIDAVLCFVAMTMALVFTLPQWLNILILIVLIGVQLVAAAGTMQGWRYASRTDLDTPS